MNAADLLQGQIADRLLQFAELREEMTNSDFQGLASAQAREVMRMCGVKEPRKVDQQQALL